MCYASEEIKGMKRETITLKPHDRCLPGNLPDIGSMRAWPPHSGHDRLACMHHADTLTLRALNHKEKT